MSTATLDLDRTQLLEKNKAIKTDSRSIPSLGTDLLESIDLSISANFLNNTLVSSTNNRNESLVKTDTVTNTDITLTSNLGSDKFESNIISTLTNPSNNSLIPGISNEINSSIDNKFETIGEEAFFGNTSGLITSASDPSITAIPVVPVTFNLSTGYTTDPTFGFDVTLIKNRIDAQEPFVSGTYTINGILRNVRDVTIDPSQFVDIDPSLKPKVSLRGNITPTTGG